MVVVAHLPSRQGVFAFMAIIVGSSALLPAQDRMPIGKPTYKTVGTQVGQAPNWMPAFEPPQGREEGDSQWPAASSAATLPPTTIVDPPHAAPGSTEMPSFLSEDGSQIFADDGFGPPEGEWGLQDESVPYGDPAAPVYSTGTWYWRGDWYVEPGFAWWTLEDTRLTVLAVDPDLGRIYTTKDVSFRYTPGLKLAVGRFLGRDAGNRDHMWELNFLGLMEWEAGYEIGSNLENTIDTRLNFGASVIGFTDANSQTYQYSSDYNSLEWNYRINTRPGRDQMAMQPDGSWVRFKNSGAVTSVIGGLRGMKLGDTVLYDSQVVSPDNENLVVQSGTYVVRTNNDMFGPQLGFERRNTYDEWGWGFRAKFGGLINLIARRSTVVTDNFGDVTTRTEQIDQEQLSFLADVGLFGHYQIRPNLFLRLGYDVNYLTGVSLAPENLGLGPEFPNLNSSGDSLYHGGTVSFEKVW